MIKKSLLCLFLTLFTLFAQVKVAINSGDPVFPFPQFMAYKNETSTYENLASKPGVGVTHAEMEQVIRDGYQIMMNRAEKTGDELEGKDYIKYLSNPQCSEGDGYGLLGAASMADKETFDGMWLYIHDYTMNKVKRYSDCQDASPGYAYSRLPGWTGSGANSAADGDFDIALALLIAYKQWGEFMGIDDNCGNPISYKYEAIEFIKALTDTIIYAANGNYLCGDIGLDGYIKGGDSWGELTDWASNTNVSGFPQKPDAAGGTAQHIDYAAPAYFRAFADFLAEEDSAKYAWNIYQLRRGEASSDWLMGKMLDEEKMLPHAGWVELSKDNEPTFTEFSDGEDFRCSWRTILNEVWHGNPTYTWDPSTHQIKKGSNSFEQDIGKRFARFLWDARQEPWENECTQNVGGDKTLGFWGPDVIKYWYTPTGEPLGTFALNWVPGTGSPAAIVSQHHDLMAELYRCLELKWDSESGDRYLGSKPHYFHGWFRMLGLLVLSGNHHSPLAIKPTANMKVYLDIDKTFAFEDDTITYTIDYRNYGSLDAKKVVITDTLHKDFIYVSSTGDGTYNTGSHTVTWSIGTVTGVKTETDLSKTKGKVKLTVKVGNASQDQYRNKVSISCSNGSGWTSSEYPNNITAVMERNYLDIAKRALVIEKKVSNTAANPGKELEVDLNFENTSKAGWINGGRPGVQFSYSAAPQPNGIGAANKLRFRLFHDADEAYIDYGNYRVSYFLFDASNTCYKNSTDCNNGWEVTKQISEGVEAESTVVLHQTITSGEDERGKWNQKIVLQFSDVEDPNRNEKLTATNYHLDWYRGVTAMIHRGGIDPLRFVWDIHNGTYTDIDWGDDWSWSENAVDEDDESRGFPITNDWTDPDNPDIVVNNYNPKECTFTTKTVDNILVEEWDGYTWRRVAGNGPLPGRDVLNVIITDTIPAGFSFSRFEGKAPFGIEPKISSDKRIITWKISKLQVQEKGTIKYVMVADGTCPMQDKTVKTKAWISADKESPTYSEPTTIKITCDYVEPALPPPTTMYKTANKDEYKKGDTIKYTIGYKQTHGSIFSGITSKDDWTSFKGDKLSIDSDGIITCTPANTGIVHNFSYGQNGTVGGTIKPVQYTGGFSLVVRQDGSDYIELRFDAQWDDIKLSIYNSSEEVYNGNFSYTNFPDAFDFKIKLSEDTLSFWAGDTAAVLPNIRQAGVDIRKGYAGIMTGKDQGSTTISNWQSHFDVAYDMVVTDKLPNGLSFVSTDGEISSGDLKGTKFTGKLNDDVIEWVVISGDKKYLDYNDSVTINLVAICKDFPHDSIVNTAFANIRGYPQNQIAARSITKAFVPPGSPHHLDIIVDTTNLKARQDEPFNSITMEQAMKSLVIYGVVRDSNNTFISYANDSKWKSRDESIAEANKQSSPSGSCLITKTGEGKTIIVISQDGILSDSIEIKAVAPPPWPVVVSATMEDDNGDLIPDQLQVILTDKPKDDQNIIRVLIDYNGNTYNIPFANTILSDTVLTLQFTSKTGIDPVPEGKVTVVLSVNKSEKRESAKITDGVGPAILSASLGEDLDSDLDTLSIVFTEPIRGLNQNKQQLQLISTSSGNKSLLTIEKIIAFENNTIATVIVSSEDDRPLELDSLRLAPKSLGNTVTDNSGNTVHDRNRPVVIMGRPAMFKSGYYVDNNADGIVDSLIMQFSKDIDRSGMILSLSWGGVRLNQLTSKTFKYGDSKSIIVVPLPDTFKTNAGIRTSGIMYPLIEFEHFPDDSRNGEILDNVAPIITDAIYTTGISYTVSKVAPDTLRVTFSEDIEVNESVNPFRLKQDDKQYTFDLKLISASKNQAIFTVNGINGIDYPSKGDSIWINHKSAIEDLNNNYQNNSSNKKVMLTVKRPNISWDLTAAPNPYYYNSESGKNKGIKIRILAPSNTKLPIVFHEAYIDIYDALGNTIVKRGKFEKNDDGIDYVWNGRNRRGRQVAPGTYLAIVNVKDEGSKGQKRIKLAIKWKK